MGQQGKPATLSTMKTLAHAIDSHHLERLHKKSHSNKPAPKHDNKSQQKSEKKPEISSSNPTKQNPPASTSSNNNKPAKPSTSGTSISVKMVSFQQRNIKDVLTTIFVYTVVVLAIRLLTARRQLPPLPRLKPAWLQSGKRKRRNQKKAKQPSGLHIARELFYPFLCYYGGSPP